MAVARTATLLFTETAGAGTYTAAIGVQPGAVVTGCNIIPLGAPWAATTAVLNVGDTAAVDDYFTAYDVDALAVYDPTNAVAGTNFDTLANGGNDYKTAPQVGYPTADLISAVIVTTGAGGATGIVAVEITGYGIPGATHRAVKV